MEKRMKIEDIIPALREGKGAYNSEFHKYIYLGEHGIYDENDCTHDFFARDFTSDKWNIVE